MKYVITLIGLGWLVMHLAATILHHLPANPVKNDLLPYVSAYISNPLLEQRWCMFAPEPATTSVKCWFRYEHGNGTWTEWYDSGESLLKRHTTNRLSYAGHLLWIHQTIGRNLHNTAIQIHNDIPKSVVGEARSNRIDELVRKTPEHAMAVRYFSDLARDMGRHHGVEPLRIQIAIGWTGPVEFSRRRTEAGGLRMKHFSFPPIKLTTGH